MRLKAGKLTKYYVGFAVLGVFTLVLLIIVLAQSGAAKADNATNRLAQKIATDLEDYISRQNRVPDQLSQVSSETVPSAITYKKLSESRYRFCIEYKTSNINTTSINPLEQYYAHFYDQSLDSQPNSYLDIASYHKKGQNCQTVEPYLINDGGTNVYDYPSDTPSYNI